MTEYALDDCGFDPLPSIVYLTGASGPATHGLRADLGLLVTPDSSLHRQIDRYRWWAADNGCFNRGDQFDPDNWMAWLTRLAQPEVKGFDGLPATNTCLFAVLPDEVGDPVATWRRSSRYVDDVKALGYAVALAAQDGLTIDTCPWDEFDCLFIGGSTEWKLSEQAIRLGREARDRGKWTHVGRVNSETRMEWCATAGFDSADGTWMAFGTDANLPRLERALIHASTHLPMFDQEWRDLEGAVA